MRKGILELCIVNLLSQGKLYGYDLVKRLAGIKGLVVTEGTAYPLLARLKKSGLLETRLVESRSGPARKYYTLTPKGRNSRRLMNAYWRDLVKGTTSLSEGEE